VSVALENGASSRRLWFDLELLPVSVTEVIVPCWLLEPTPALLEQLVSFRRTGKHLVRGLALGIVSMEVSYHQSQPLPVFGLGDIIGDLAFVFSVGEQSLVSSKVVLYLGNSYDCFIKLTWRSPTIWYWRVC
jgi:hypothetical protein